MKQELQKLQQESKSGQKSKDVATKDLDAAKKKLQEVEAKLKVITSDKQAALQVKQLSELYLAGKASGSAFSSQPQHCKNLAIMAVHLSGATYCAHMIFHHRLHWLRPC